MSSKYYAGIHSSELSHQQRTSYKWNFKNVSNDEELKLELTRDRVDTNTFDKTWKESETAPKTKPPKENVNKKRND